MGRVDSAPRRGDLGEGHDLIRFREGSRLVDEPGREPERALVHRLRDELLHPLELRRRRLHVVEPEHRPPNLGRPDQDGEVHRRTRLAQPPEVPGQILPVDLQLELAQEVLVLLDPARGHRSGRDAFAGQLGGDALADLRLRPWIDEDLHLALAEQVDEPGAEREPVQVDAAARPCLLQIADGGDPGPADRHVGTEPGRAGPVDHAGVGKDQVEDGGRDERDHAGGATTTTPSSPTAPSTTARTGSIRRASVARETSPSVTTEVVKWQVGGVPARAPRPDAQRIDGTRSRSAMRPSMAPPPLRNRPTRSATFSPTASGACGDSGPSSAGRSRGVPRAEAETNEFSNSATAVSAHRPAFPPCEWGSGTRSDSAFTPWARSLRAAPCAARRGSSSRPSAVAATSATWRRIPRCTMCSGVSAGA